MRKKNIYDLLDLKRELKKYIQVCEGKRVRYEKYDVDVSIGYSQWKEDIISKIKVAVERKNIPNRNKEKEYIINYLHHVAECKRFCEYDKDPFINTLTFLLSVLFSGIISFKVNEFKFEGFIVLMFLLTIIFSVGILQYYSKQSLKISFYDDVMEILKEYVETNYEE